MRIPISTATMVKCMYVLMGITIFVIFILTLLKAFHVINLNDYACSIGVTGIILAINACIFVNRLTNDLNK